jgi:hypothetical protein
VTLPGSADDENFRGLPRFLRPGRFRLRIEIIGFNGQVQECRNRRPSPFGILGGPEVPGQRVRGGVSPLPLLGKQLLEDLGQIGADAVQIRRFQGIGGVQEQPIQDGRWSIAGEGFPPAGQGLEEDDAHREQVRTRPGFA